jgi:hypothetical protein
MKVKLTSREPNQELLLDPKSDARWPDDCWWQGRLTSQGVKLGYWRPIHDAAPEDATKALEGLLAALGNWIDTPDDEYLEEAREHYQKLLATEIGTALIRQAEERGDG